MRDPISLIAQGSWRAASKADSHADVTRREPKPLVEALRICSRLMRQQFDEIAAARFRFRHRPLHQLLADAAAAAIGSNADVFEQTAQAALRAETRQDRELQAADHPALALGNHELDILIALDPRECLVIGRMQRVVYALACAPEMIVGEHRHNRSNILAARGTNGDGFGVHKVTPASARLNAPWEARERSRLRRSSGGWRHNDGDRSRLHARRAYRQAARRRQAKRHHRRRSG